MDQGHTSYTMYMDDIISPGVSGYQYTNPAQNRTDSFRQNHPDGTTGYNPGQLVDTVMYASGAAGPRFSPPANQGTVYRRNYYDTTRREMHDNISPGSSGTVSSSGMPVTSHVGNAVGNTEHYTVSRFTTPAPVVNRIMFGNYHGPVESTNNPENFPNPCRTGTESRNIIDSRESNNFTRLQEREGHIQDEDVVDTACKSPVIDNENVSVKHNPCKKPDIEQSVTVKTKEQSEINTITESVEEKVRKERKSGESDRKGNIISTTYTDKETVSEYFGTNNPKKKSETNNNTQSDTLKTNNVEAPVKKIKLILKIDSKTSCTTQSDDLDTEEEDNDHPTPDSSQDKDKSSHACINCGKTYTRKDHLMRHIQTAHSDLRPFICKVCSSTFSRKDRLTRHEKIHSGSPQFSCQVCEKKFFRKDSLRKHLLTESGCKTERGTGKIKEQDMPGKCKPSAAVKSGDA